MKNIFKFKYARSEIVCWSLLLALCCPPSVLAQVDEWQFSNVNRIVAVGDVHGAFEALVATLQAADVIDEGLTWSGADTHLVMTGDLLDRGPDSRRIMDLIMRLEQEAAAAGGQVHQLLGNHEVMNLIGDVRYVSLAEFAAFSPEESAAEREHWFQRFLADQPEDADEFIVQTQFDEKAPPGFFGHRRAFRADGEYGKWLLEKPLMVVINGTAFTHGGAPPFVAEHGLAGVNGSLKKDLVDYVSTLSGLIDKDVLSPVVGFREQQSSLAERMEAGEIDEADVASAQAIIDLGSSPIHSSTGPLWYRGTALCNRLIEEDGLKAALARIGATRIVNGHTTTDSRNVEQRMDGRVFRIDTGMLKESYHGSGNALVFEGEKLFVVNQDSTQDLAPVTSPQHVAYEPDELDDEMLTNILTNGVVVGQEVEGGAWSLVRVELEDKSVTAYFNSLEQQAGFVPEVAAYRLDRMLGLYMVPVTVQREIAGKPGTLQYVPVEMINETARVAEDEGKKAYCSMEKQRTAMYVFDTLINNPVRTPLSMLYNPDNWNLVLVDHENSFETGTDLPSYLGKIEYVVNEQWRSTLQGLDDQTLRRKLGEVLNDQHLAELAQRRDVLLRKTSH